MMITVSYLLDYSILITVLFTLLPVIDSICDILGKIIIYISKMIIRFVLYYLLAIIYVYWFALIINVMVSLFQIKNYESTNTFVEEQNNLI